MRALKHTYRLLIVVAVAACASSGASDGRARYDANLITAEELTGRSDALDRSALDAIQRLRPQWLRRTGFAEGGFPSLFLDNQPYELEVKELDRLREALESIRPDQVAEMRFVSPTDASIRYGTGYPSGVIEVITRNR